VEDHGRARSVDSVSEDPTRVPPTGAKAPHRLIRSPSDLAGGLFLIILGCLAWWFGQPLKVGTAFRMGPGYVPNLLSVIVVAFGVCLCAAGLARRGTSLERWRLRPMLLVIGSMVVFSLTIERLGLLVASALVVLMAGVAAPSARLRQLLMLAVALAGLACVLFPVVLQLPMRILP
jgi:putative tricarboxylic transport membrane protein